MRETLHDFHSEAVLVAVVEIGPLEHLLHSSFAVGEKHLDIEAFHFCDYLLQNLDSHRIHVADGRAVYADEEHIRHHGERDPHCLHLYYGNPQGRIPSHTKPTLLILAPLAAAHQGL